MKDSHKLLFDILAYMMYNTNMQEVQRTTIYLPIEQHLALKIYAAKKKVSVAEIIRDLIAGLLAEKV